MENLRLRPLFTRSFDAADDFTPPRGAAYLFAASEEERSRHVETMQVRAQDCQFVRLEQSGEYQVTVAETGAEFGLRSAAQLESLLATAPGTPLFLDMTGMSHSLWAPLVRTALALGRDLRVVYLEPRSYAYSQSPREGELFALSDSRQGMGPIPTFATLRDVPPEQVCLIPLLGFEGSRLAYVIEQTQPQRDRIIPIVGMPGFRAEYPFHAYHANGRTLIENNTLKDIRPARANCPFSCYYVLTDIMAELPDLHFKIATIGTKPHALGAVLRALAEPARSVELVYDHVRRKANRTSGADHCLVYDVTGFLASLGDS